MSARTAAALACVSALALPAAAGANGDPPSQALPSEDVYLPANPPSGEAARELQDTAKRARAAGYPIKVAVVQSRLDLGTLAEAFGEPQRYAEYLASDLRRHPSLRRGIGVLVVMPAGAGVSGKPFNGRELQAARTIRVSTDADSDQLTRAAADTLVRMSAAGGHDIGEAGGGGGGGGALVAGIVMALLLGGAVAAGAATRARRRREDVSQ